MARTLEFICINRSVTMGNHSRGQPETSWHRRCKLALSDSAPDGSSDKLGAISKLLCLGAKLTPWPSIISRLMSQLAKLSRFAHWNPLNGRVNE